MNRDRSLILAGGAMLLVSLIWGYNYVVMKRVMQYVDPFDFSALRTLIGAISLFAVLALRRRSLRLVAPGTTLWLGLLQTAAFTGLLQCALVGGGAGKTAVLVYTMPFWLMAMAWMFLGERMRGVQWLANGLALAGLVLVLEPWRMHGDVISAALGVSAGFVWAISAVLVKRLRAKVQVDLLSLTAWQMLFGSLVLCVLAWVLPSEPPRITPYFVGALAYNALFATALAWLLWLFILDRLPAGLAGLSSLAVPAVGVLSGWVELGERPDTMESLGMVCIAAALVGVSVVAMRGRNAVAARTNSGARG
ncbi:DMT family transporter [Aromatoleum toluclasticum]|uniref:DMT family transporter n=1 Tax=Aromatoleum toluclasticum TaxID=92003 RepID=UPI001D18E7CF|nr:EamA family transporter [Aromatoleum toluclasticum]MCC4118402.1 DMT family transporter [Aromatoleum toluclasticum]